MAIRLASFRTWRLREIFYEASSLASWALRGVPGRPHQRGSKHARSERACSSAAWLVLASRCKSERSQALCGGLASWHIGRHVLTRGYVGFQSADKLEFGTHPNLDIWVVASIGVIDWVRRDKSSSFLQALRIDGFSEFASRYTATLVIGFDVRWSKFRNHFASLFITARLGT
ncbi:hypothetical protein GGR57DRAFT_467449 [Xylariaceae sp. FL1272]|nr:hypothetical protein GGR57DRAFT_467449 [Xylariaceae sp. FL1272]